jgi:hypothetical protein
MSTCLATEVVVSYCTRDALHAVLTVQHLMGFRELTILHEQINAEVLVYEISGAGCTEKIEVATGETLTFISRSQGCVVATFIAEVDMESDELDYILSPRGGYNLMLEQIGLLHEEDLPTVEAEVLPC